jgi:hypothetical protein
MGFGPGAATLLHPETLERKDLDKLHARLVEPERQHRANPAFARRITRREPDKEDVRCAI